MLLYSAEIKIRRAIICHITLQEAQTRLPDFIQRALKGEEVIIEVDKKHSIKLAPIKNGPKRQIGADKGLVEIADDFDAPLDDFQEYMI